MEKGLNAKKLKTTIFSLFMFAIIVYIVMEISFKAVSKNNNNSYYNNFIETNTLFEHDSEDNASIYMTQSKGFYYITKDFVKFIDKRNREVFSHSITINSPVYVTHYDMLALYEHQGNYLYVFAPNGLLYSKEFEYPIINVSVNKEGYSSVLVQKGDEYKNYIIKNELNELKETYGSYENSRVFPITSTISDDKDIFVTSFIDINGLEINSIVEYSVLNKSDSIKNNATSDGVFSRKEENLDEIIAILKFIDNNNMITVSNKNIKCINIASKPNYSVEAKWTVELPNRISKISFNQESGFAVAYGESFINEQNPKPPGAIEYYNLDGELLWQFHLDKKITYLNSSSIGTIIGSGREFIALNNKGNILWRYRSPQNVNFIDFLDNTNNIIECSNQFVKTYKLSKNSFDNNNIDEKELYDKEKFDINDESWTPELESNLDEKKKTEKYNDSNEIETEIDNNTADYEYSDYEEEYIDYNDE